MCSDQNNIPNIPPCIFQSIKFTGTTSPPPPHPHMVLKTNQQLGMGMHCHQESPYYMERQPADCRGSQKEGKEGVANIQLTAQLTLEQVKKRNCHWSRHRGTHVKWLTEGEIQLAASTPIKTENQHTMGLTGTWKMSRQHNNKDLSRLW